MRVLLASVLVGSIALWAFAVRASSGSKVSYDQLCTYDKYCSYVKNSDGSLIVPKEPIMRTLEVLRDPLKEISSKFGVDPRAVAGAILAENTVNVQIDDELQNFLVKTRLTPSASLFGKSFSVGLGQINLPTAMDVEPIVAKLEGREPRLEKEIAKALLTPKGALTYAAGIIRQAQDEYAKVGFDISKDPAVLVSLYNLGDPKKRAAEAKANKMAPRPNYFGFFVQEHLEAIGSRIEWDKPPKPGATHASLDLMIERRLRVTVHGYSAPTTCRSEGAGEVSKFNKIASRETGEERGRLYGRYTIINRGIDCDLKEWVMIQTDSGKVGWLTEETLKKYSSENPITNSEITCQNSIDPACHQNFKSKLKSDLLGQNGSLLEVRLSADSRNPEHVNFKKFSEQCLLAERLGSTGLHSFQQKPLSKEEHLALAKRYKEKRVEILTHQGLGPNEWHSPLNLYRGILGSDYLMDESYCDEGCEIQGRDRLEELLNTDFSKIKTLQQYSELANSYHSVQRAKSKSKAVQASPSEFGIAYVAMIEKDCAAVFQLLPSALQRLRTAAPKLRKAEDVSSIPEEWIEAPKACVLYNEVRNPSQTEAKTATEASSGCTDCDYVRIYQVRPGSLSSTSISKAIVRKFFENDDDVRHYFDSLFAYTATSSYDPVSDCLYDPFKSADRIEKLLDDPCVESALVPDRFLLKKINHSKKTFFMNFVTEDRFALKMKDSCRGLFR